MDRARRKLIGTLASLPMAIPSLAQHPVPRGKRKRVVICLFPTKSSAQEESTKKGMTAIYAARGFVVGENLDLEIVRVKSTDWIGEGAGEWEQAARRVVSSRPDAIVVQMVWLDFFKRLTSEIPIVFLAAVDTGRHGGIASLRRPGGNVTGVAIPFLELQQKRFELLKDLRPQARRLGVVFAGGEYDDLIKANVKAAAQRLGVEGAAFPMAQDSESLLPVVKNARVDLLDFLWFPSRPGVFEELIKLGIVSSFAGGAGFVDAGGLLCYLPVDTDEIAADIVARILRGESVGTIPAQQPTRFYLALNLRTAKRLGITVPQSILLRADDLIE